MPLPQRLSPLTSRLAHTLTAKKTTRFLVSDRSLANAPLAIYFGGPVGDVYQVVQWLPVFEQLADSLPCVVLVKNAQAARALAAASTLPVRLAGHADAIEPLAEQYGIKAVFYVNNNLANFSPLRIANVAHIHLSHGESEKASMVSNQLKAYDYCFIAGQAAYSRITSALSRFDPAHLKQIGRPQLEELLISNPLSPAGDRKTVLYAPTWEGDRKAMAYSSLATAGESWVREILDDPGLRLIYRPHPKTGTRNKAVRVANAQIKKLIHEANGIAPTAGHTVDDQIGFHQALVSADVAIFDVSAMAMDFSVLNRPYFVSVPKKLESDFAQSPLWKIARRITPDEGAGVAKQLWDALSEGPRPSSESFIVDHFGDTTLGASAQRFENAIRDLI